MILLLLVVLKKTFHVLNKGGGIVVEEIDGYHHKGEVTEVRFQGFEFDGYSRGEWGGACC